MKHRQTRKQYFCRQCSLSGCLTSPAIFGQRGTDVAQQFCRFFFIVNAGMPETERKTTHNQLDKLFGGADLGHINRFLSVALRLRDQGHRQVMLLRDITRAESILGEHGLEFFQAPVWLTQIQGLPPDINFTETLYRFGYLYPDGLMSMATAWRNAWKLLQPQLMIFDHAPSALLAARRLGIPRVLIGNSFGIPPLVRPLPRFRWWTDGLVDQTRLAETEARATRNSNAVLMRLGAPPITQVSDLFQAEATLICGRPALDVYGERKHGEYIGPINNVTSGVNPIWPPGENPRIFAYLKPQYKHFDALLNAIKSSKARYLIYAPGIPEALVKRYQSSHVSFSAAPLRMEEVVRTCNALICHAGGMTDIALEASKPILLLPTQMEQTMTSHRAEALGAGIVMPLDGNPGALPKLIKRLLEDGQLSVRAAEYAASLPFTDQSNAVDRVVDTCQTLLAGAVATN